MVTLFQWLWGSIVWSKSVSVTTMLPLPLSLSLSTPFSLSLFLSLALSRTILLLPRATSSRFFLPRFAFGSLKFFTLAMRSKCQCCSYRLSISIIDLKECVMYSISVGASLKSQQLWESSQRERVCVREWVRERESRTKTVKNKERERQSSTERVVRERESERDEVSEKKFDTRRRLVRNLVVA